MATEHGGAGSEFNPILIQLAFLFTVVGCCISLYSVWLHLKNYRKPNQQRQVIRILWMVPIYGISTFISLVSLNVAFYVDTFRDIYEAFVIYAFFNLLLNKLGGERELLIMLHARPPSENFFPGTCYSRDIFVGDPYTFLFVKRGILQFVYVKPVLALLTMVLKVSGNYQEGEFSWSSSYLYLTFFYNLSVCLSLWCLMVFFYATKQDLKGFRPLPKFLSVKAIIFFSFWQGVVIALLVAMGLIPESEHISVAIQDFLVCIEMVPFAVAHAFAFSYLDYFDQTVHTARMPFHKALQDSFGLKDVFMDTRDTLHGDKFSYRSFEPSEGLPHMGSSRTSRIMAGLRYSNKTSKKHWIEPAPPSRYLNSSGLDETLIQQETEPLEFPDPRPTDDLEELYEDSRKMEFGDYNYPVVDFRVPLWRLARQYGGVDNIENPILKQQEEEEEEEETLLPREGCIDVVVEQGRGNYVLKEELDQEEEEEQVVMPQPPSRKPTLTEIPREEDGSPLVPEEVDQEVLEEVTQKVTEQVPSSAPQQVLQSGPEQVSQDIIPDVPEDHTILYPTDTNTTIAVPPIIDTSSVKQNDVLTGNVWKK